MILKFHSTDIKRTDAKNRYQKNININGKKFSNYSNCNYFFASVIVKKYIALIPSICELIVVYV